MGIRRTERIGRHLERIGPGEFKLIGEIPEGTIDAHVHLGSYLRLPVLGGFNLTGPGSYRENLRFHLGELMRYGMQICKELPDHFPGALEGILDVAPLKTDVRGPGPTPIHLLTSLPSLFDADAPCYLRPPKRLSLALLREIAATARRYPSVLKEANALNLRRYLQTFGIEKAVVLPVESGRFSRFTRVTMEICRDSHEFIPFCSIHPRHPAVAEKLSHDRSEGAVGLKFHPEFQQVVPDSREALLLFELCETYKMPIQCHVGGLRKGARLSHPDRYAQAVSRFPDVPFILCHVGLADHEKTIDLAATCSNVYLETSGQAAGVIRKAADRIGTDRVIFGTDWPLYHPAVSISRVLEAFPKDRDRQRVFRENVKRILGQDVT